MKTTIDLTNKEKAEVLKETLKQIQSSVYSPICISIAQVLCDKYDTFPLYKVIQKDFMLKQFEPVDTFGIWFPLNRHGQLKRIEILSTLIKHFEQKDDDTNNIN